MMSTFLTVLASIPGYLAIGLIWARMSAVRVQEYLNWAKEKGESPSWGTHLEGQLLAHTALWPLPMIGNLVQFVLGWAAKPVDKRREEVSKLRANAKRMEELAGWLTGDTESAEALAKTYQEMADKLDL